MRTIVTLAGLGLWAIVGCGGYEPAAPPPAAPGSQQAKTTTPSQPGPPTPSPSAPTQSGTTVGMAGIGAAVGAAPMDLMSGPQNVQPARAAQPQPAPQTNMVKAEAGVQKQGHNYGGGALAAPITVPIATYFQTRSRITFDIQVADAMRLYKATNGNAPKTHEEFMEKIIKENQIKLPDLPQGDQYVYDPADEQLKVRQAPRQ